MNHVPFYRKCMNYINIVNRIVEIFATLTLIFAVIAVFFQIIFRILGMSNKMQWVWESIILINIWITYFGASVLQKEEKHINLHAYEFLPKKVQNYLLFLVRIIIILTSITVSVQAYKLMVIQMENPFITLPYLTRGHGTISIVIGFSLMAVYTLFNLLTSVKHISTSKEEK